MLPLPDGVRQEIGEVDYIVHMGAETHVDRSIIEPRPFVYSNVIGTFEMLEFARSVANLKKFIYMSTDEVFGPSDDSYAFKEWDRYKSSTPYSASKAGGEELCVAYHNTYRLPTIIVHTMNVFGERQHPEKFIPKMVKQLLNDDEITLYWDEATKAYSSRCWIHARNVADAVLFLIEKGVVGDKYNVIGERRTNYELACLARDAFEMHLTIKVVDAKQARPGHDLHYALNGLKMAKLGWKAPVDFENSFVRTIKWFAEHRTWLG